MLTRATRNLASAWSGKRATGSSRRSCWPKAVRLDGPGGHNILADYAGEAMRALLHRRPGALARVDEQLVSAVGGTWDAARLRPERCGGSRPPTPDAAAALADARASGFHRPLWAALAGAALCHALQAPPHAGGRAAGGADRGVGEVAVLPSGEWVCKAAARRPRCRPGAGGGAAGAASRTRHHTRWSRAALHTVTATVALADVPASAGAASPRGGPDPRPDSRGHRSDDVALALAAAAFGHAGRPGLSRPAHHQVQAFAGSGRRAPGCCGSRGGSSGYRPPY